MPVPRRSTIIDSDIVECDFCNIVAGGADTEVVGRGPGWVAFFPISPATRGHTLVIPVSHVRNFWEADSEVIAEVTRGCLEVGRALSDVLGPEGMNLITSAGDAAEQTVEHLHLHVVPRWHGDGIDRIWPEDRVTATATATLARDLRAALGGPHVG